MQIAMVLYDRFTALDIIGPYEVLSRIPDARVDFVAERTGPVRADTGFLAVTADKTLGSLVLAAAGLLEGHRATSHWVALDLLKQFGAEPTGERVVFDGKYVTAAGVSAGIDMGLTLVGRIAGDEHAQAVQLLTEYDPQPPYDAGSPEKAPAHLVEEFRTDSRFSLA